MADGLTAVAPQRSFDFEANARRLTRRATDEFGAFLSRPQWDWYTTHTFKAEYVSPKEADRHYFAWLNSLILAARVRNYERPFWFRGTEYQDRGTLHFHSLIGGVGDIRRLLFKDFWELHGFARVEKYEPGKGANYYVGKYLTKLDADIKFSHNLQQELERTPGEVAVSGYMAKGAGKSLVRVFASTQVTNSKPGVLG